MRGRPGTAVLLPPRAHTHLLTPLPPVSAHSTYLVHTQLSPLPSDKEKTGAEITPEEQTHTQQVLCAQSRHIGSHMVTAPMREDEEAGGPLQMSTGSLLATGQMGRGDTGPSGVTLLSDLALQAKRSEQRQTAPERLQAPDDSLAI